MREAPAAIWLLAYEPSISDAFQLRVGEELTCEDLEHLQLYRN